MRPEYTYFISGGSKTLHRVPEVDRRQEIVATMCGVHFPKRRLFRFEDDVHVFLVNRDELLRNFHTDVRFLVGETGMNQLVAEHGFRLCKSCENRTR